MTIKNQLERSYRKGEIKFTVEERNRDRVVSKMPVTPGILNPYGIVQAGAMLWLADVTASILILENIDLKDDGKGFPLAVNLNSSLLANQRDGEILAEAGFIRNGQRVKVVRTRVTGRNNKLLAEVTTTHIPAE